jgi:Mg2+/Co2+ transporter CorC
MKDFVNVINRNGEDFQYILYKFLWISNAKVKDVIFVGPQIMAVTNDKNCDEVLQGIVNYAWEALQLVVDNFLGRQDLPRAR